MLRAVQLVFLTGLWIPFLLFVGIDLLEAIDSAHPCHFLDCLLGLRRRVLQTFELSAFLFAVHRMGLPLACAEWSLPILHLYAFPVVDNDWRLATGFCFWAQVALARFLLRLCTYLFSAIAIPH